jgi:prepilin-type N-terminal cleavage/methylation domain-containing protein
MMATQKNKRCGFTIAEMLVALAVTGILLTAVAVAFNASAINYNENRDMFNAINMGRQAMMRMTSQLRTATAVELPTNEANTRCSLVTAENTNIRFCFHNAAKTVYLHPLVSGNPTASYPLCQNVSAMTFSRTVVSGVVKSVQISMTINVDNTSQTITSAVVLRKTL